MEGNMAQTRSRHILFCRCGGERIDGSMITSVEKIVKDIHVPVTVLTDLCGLAARKNQQLVDLFRTDTDYLVIGCYRRTMNLLIDQVREAPEPWSAEHCNMLEDPLVTVMEKIRNFSENVIGDPVFRELTDDSGWPSWYPVIDEIRCTHCGQCADFCLFGVYEKTDDRILVVNPEGCKNNCPACARICPSAAIVFPKYANGGAIGGSEVFDEQAELQRQAKDIEQFLGDDLYLALERRKAKRKSIIRDDSMAKALAERAQAKSSMKKM
jgi:ferredoxin